MSVVRRSCLSVLEDPVKATDQISHVFRRLREGGDKALSEVIAANVLIIVYRELLILACVQPTISERLIDESLPGIVLPRTGSDPQIRLVLLRYPQVVNHPLIPFRPTLHAG